MTSGIHKRYYMVVPAAALDYHTVQYRDHESCGFWLKKLSCDIDTTVPEFIIVSQCASTNTVRVISGIFILVLTKNQLIFFTTVSDKHYIFISCQIVSIFFGKYDTKRPAETCVFGNSWVSGNKVLQPWRVLRLRYLFVWF